MIADTAFRSALALLGIWVAVYYFWKDYRNDAFRDHVFSIRDRMFLYAANGNVSFDHPAYTILRNRMNGLLRHGHEFTLTRMVLVIATHPTVKTEVTAKWELALAELPQETQAKLKEFNLCAAVAVLQHMVYCSFFRYLLVRPMTFFFNTEVRGVVQRPKVVQGVEQLECESLEKEKRLLTRAVTA